MVSDSSLKRDIQNIIKLQGPMPISSYMTICLQHPAKGYYTSKESIAKDFITAPEISQMFGESLAIWILQNLQKTPTNIIEYGPGRGTLMRDILTTIDGIMPNKNAKAGKVLLVDSSKLLKRKQDKLLAKFKASGNWQIEAAQEILALDDASDNPVIIANEYLDALPVRQFQKKADGWVEICLDMQLKQIVCPANSVAKQFIPSETYAKAPKDAVVEVRAGVDEWLAQIKPAMRLNGLCLVIDYGYNVNADFKRASTLQAMEKGKHVDPFANPGNADITAHLDFADLAHKASMHGFNVTKPITQKQFLKAMFIEERAERLAKSQLENANKPGDKVANKLDIVADCQRLLQMGSFVQVMAIYGEKQNCPYPWQDD